MKKMNASGWLKKHSLEALVVGLILAQLATLALLVVLVLPRFDVSTGAFESPAVQEAATPTPAAWTLLIVDVSADAVRYRVAPADDPQAVSRSGYYDEPLPQGADGLVSWADNLMEMYGAETGNPVVFIRTADQSPRTQFMAGLLYALVVRRQWLRLLGE
jgi:hypothetical protein